MAVAEDEVQVGAVPGAATRREEEGGAKDDGGGNIQLATQVLPELGSAQTIDDDARTKGESIKGKKRKKRGSDDGIGGDEEAGLPDKKKAPSVYWLGLSREAGVSVNAVKKVHNAMRTAARRDLLDADIGSFTLHGLASFSVKQVKFRQAYTATIRGKRVNVSARQPCKKIYATSLMKLKGLSD